MEGGGEGRKEGWGVLGCNAHEREVGVYTYVRGLIVSGVPCLSYIQVACLAFLYSFIPNSPGSTHSPTGVCFFLSPPPPHLPPPTSPPPHLQFNSNPNPLSGSGFSRQVCKLPQRIWRKGGGGEGWKEDPGIYQEDPRILIHGDGSW